VYKVNVLLVRGSHTVFLVYIFQQYFHDARVPQGVRVVAIENRGQLKVVLLLVITGGYIIGHRRHHAVHAPH